MSTLLDAIERASETLYEQLSGSSSRSFRGYETVKPLPRIPIPGELAFYLDDLLERAGTALGLSPEEILADVVDLGIITWYERLSGEARARLGVPPAAATHLDTTGDKERLLNKLARSQSELEEERTRLISEIRRLREQQVSDADEISNLKKEIQSLSAVETKPAENVQAEKVVEVEAPPKAEPVKPARQIADDEDDDDSALHQAQAHALATANVGYTEMTAHSIPAGKGNGNGGGGGGKKRPAKVENRRRPQQGGGGRNQRNRNPRRSYGAN